MAVRTRDTYAAMQPRQRGLFGDAEQAGPTRAARSNLVDLTLELREDRPLSIAVTDPARPGGKRLFLPKSQIEYEIKAPGVVVVTLPEWLARDKGLI